VNLGYLVPLDSFSPYIIFNTIPSIMSFSQRRSRRDFGEGIREKVKVGHLYISSSEICIISEALITQLLGYTANRPQLPSPRKHSPDGATHLITAYYSFIDPERMKG